MLKFGFCLNLNKIRDKYIRKNVQFHVTYSREAHNPLNLSALFDYLSTNPRV